MDFNSQNSVLIGRRAVLRGLIAAPAIVAASSLMPVRLPSILKYPRSEWIIVRYNRVVAVFVNGPGPGGLALMHYLPIAEATPTIDTLT